MKDIKTKIMENKIREILGEFFRTTNFKVATSSILALIAENTASVSDGDSEFSDLHDVSDRNAERSDTTQEHGPSVEEPLAIRTDSENECPGCGDAIPKGMQYCRDCWY